MFNCEFLSAFKQEDTEFEKFEGWQSCSLQIDNFKYIILIIGYPACNSAIVIRSDAIIVIIYTMQYFKSDMQKFHKILNSGALLV